MTGNSATVVSTNTTVGFPAISGWSYGRKKRFIDFHLKNPLEGYRRLTFMMLDAGVAAVSPASVWRVLQQAGLLSRWKRIQSPYHKWRIYKQKYSKTRAYHLATRTSIL